LDGDCAVPELPEVETVRRGLNNTTLEQPITGVEVLLDRTIAHPNNIAAFQAGLLNTQLKTWHRRGKYLIGELADGAGHLGIHLRMTGQALWTRPEVTLEKHTRVRFFLGDRELRYVDQRTFGQIWWVPPGIEPPEIMHGLKSLGPEPFDDAFSDRYLADWMRDRKRPIKNALLDQSLVAGVGNIYADESLFLSGINPLTHCASLKPKQLSTLRKHVIDVLQTSISASGTTLRDYRTVEGVNGNYGSQAWVYGRDKNPCRVCGTTIERLKLAGRSAHFCPHCQPI
jgi:formamidopyrimidine-DNA glycosylase